MQKTVLRDKKCSSSDTISSKFRKTFWTIYNAQKMKFSIWMYSVNVTKSAGTCGFGHIYWRKLEWKTSLVVQWWKKFFCINSLAKVQQIRVLLANLHCMSCHWTQHYSCNYLDCYNFHWYKDYHILLK